VDKLGRIQVGPESAGSEPGPAAYGRGGCQPTVTDADICLGRVHTDSFAGGAFDLDTQAASRAVEAVIGDVLNLDSDLAAFGISEVVDENMSLAARAHAAEFGMDLAHRDMVAFGGAAPLHAARLGEKLGVERIVIPTEAGVGSAVGFLLAPIAYEVVRSRHQNLSELDPGVINQLMKQMHDEALAVVRQGTTQSELLETRQAYMRYVGQGHEIAVDLPVETYGNQHALEFQHLFEVAYTKLYGRPIRGVAIEALSWTLTIATPSTGQPTIESTRPPKRLSVEPAQIQSFYDPVTTQRCDIPVYLREQLQPGMEIPGPALIAEDQTTTVITSHYDATIDSHHYIVLNRRNKGAGHD
jgi:N-methylhydantoinase A